MRGEEAAVLLPCSTKIDSRPVALWTMAVILYEFTCWISLPIIALLLVMKQRPTKFGGDFSGIKSSVEPTEVFFCGFIQPSS